MHKFLRKLQTEKKVTKKVKPAKPIKLIDSLFLKGDCLIYKMIDGNFGGAFVLTDEQKSEVGANFIAITNISKTEKPTVADFKKSEVYVKRQKDFNLSFGKLKERWKDVPQIGVAMAIDFQKEKIEIEVIGKLKLYKQYRPSNSYMGLPWNQLLKILPDKEEYQKQNGLPKTRIKLSKWIKRNWL